MPFGVVLLWLLYESKKVKTILLAALVLLSMVCMFFHEAFAPSREYPWDCMVEHIFTGTLLPFLCLLGYLLYVFLCACIPVYRKVWKGIGFFVLGGMSLAFEYVNVFFPVALLAGYLFRFTIFRKFRNHLPLVRKCHGVLAVWVIPGICLIGFLLRRALYATGFMRKWSVTWLCGITRAIWYCCPAVFLIWNAKTAVLP